MSWNPVASKLQNGCCPGHFSSFFFFPLFSLVLISCHDLLPPPFSDRYCFCSSRLKPSWSLLQMLPCPNLKIGICCSALVLLVIKQQNHFLVVFFLGRLRLEENDELFCPICKEPKWTLPLRLDRHQAYWAEKQTSGNKEINGTTGQQIKLNGRKMASLLLFTVEAEGKKKKATH